MNKIEQLKNIFKEKKYVFINIDTKTNNKNNTNINLPIKYKATIYETPQGLVFIKVFDINNINKTIFTKTCRDLDEIIKVLTYLI